MTKKYTEEDLKIALNYHSNEGQAWLKMDKWKCENMVWDIWFQVRAGLNHRLWPSGNPHVQVIKSAILEK